MIRTAQHELIILDAGVRVSEVLIHRGALSVPAAVVFAGVLLLATGRHSPRLFIVRPDERLTALQWGITVIMVALVLAIELGLTGFLQARGYGPLL